MKDSDFRLWVQHIWHENTREKEQFHELPFTMKEYWQRYKFWLKREYKHRKNQSNDSTN